MPVLVLVAFDLTRALGFPADAITVERDDPDGLATCLAVAASQEVVQLSREVVEVWRLDPEATGWDGRIVKVAKLKRGRWVDRDGELLGADQVS